MKVIDDPEAALWLRGLDDSEDNFDWDDGNRGKNLRKHGIADEEIQSLLLAASRVFYGRIVEPDHGEWRGILLSETVERRRLALIFARRGLRIRPISCRPMRSKEKETYAAANTQA